MKKREGNLIGRLFLPVIALILFAALVLATGPYFHTSETTTIGYEDNIVTYNFTANVSNPDNDVLFFTITNITADPDLGVSSIDDYYWISLNSSTGILTINATLDNETSNFTISVKVSSEGEQSGHIQPFYFNISAVNDAPKFANLGGNRTLDKSPFELILYATDEENDNNFTFNVSFISCPGGGSCQLFNLTYYNATATNISFTPLVSEAGTYEINFSVKDNRSSGFYSEFWNWTIIWNYDPYFTYVCDNERSTTENSEFTCWVNVSDIDEENNLTLTANYTWFTFNGSVLSNTITVPVSDGNVSALVNFTANDTMVGNWSVNISVTDTGSVTGRNSTTFYFFIDNVNDSLFLYEIDNITGYNSSNYTLYVNASDDDILVPDKNVFNETLTFHLNNSNASVVSTQIIQNTNITTATITIDTQRLGIGNHTIKIWVNDSNNFSSMERDFTIQIFENSEPVWNALETNYSYTEGDNIYLNLSGNVTDADPDDNITFSYTSDTSFASFSINETTGIINFTATDFDVGSHIVTITATDGKTPVSMDFNFTINNTNDPPIIDEPLTTSPSSARIDTASNMNFTVDTAAIIFVEVWDEDFKIPSEQSSFYKENLSLNLTIEGPNTSLFAFEDDIAISGKQNKTRFTASFTPTSSDIGNYNITINVSDASNLSDIIMFNLSVSQATSTTETTTTTPTTSSGGGGGSDTPVTLKIITPGPVSSRRRDTIILPVQLYNSGKTTLSEIVLTASIAKDGIIRDDILVSFDQSTFSSLKTNERKNVTLTIDVNTEELGLYEITINATVKSPSYSDWGKIYLTVEEGLDIQEKIIFTEEYIVGNPECAELKEIVDEAKELYSKGDLVGSKRKLDEALEACKMAISQTSITGGVIRRFEENAISYTAIASLLAALLGLAYYQYRRFRLKRALSFPQD